MRALVLTIVLSVLVTGGSCVGQVRIELRDSSVVRNAQVTLGEIATFHGTDAQTQARLAEVVIGSAPLPGLQRVITLEQIVTRLRQHGFRPEAFAIVAPAKIVVRREAYLFRAQQAVDAAVQKLRETVPLSDNAQAICDTPLRDLTLPNNKVQVTAGEPRALGAGLYTVPVQIASEGASTLTLNVRLRVSQLREVLVATKAIRSGEAIDPDAVKVQRLATNPEDTELLTDLSEVTGKIARHAIAAGKPLKRSAIDEPAVIRRGQNVKLVVRLDGAAIETGAIALQDGKAGARIRVQVVDTRKTLLATVTDTGCVTVDMQ